MEKKFNIKKMHDYLCRISDALIECSYLCYCKYENNYILINNDCLIPLNIKSDVVYG